LTSWDEATAFFQEEGKQLVELAQPLSLDLFEKRVLIKPILGIEDSSRYWSVAMCLEHLVIVDRGIADIAVSLSQGRAYPRALSIAEVKPDRLVTACANCRMMIEEGLEYEEMDMEVMGIMDLIATHMVEH